MNLKYTVYNCCLVKDNGHEIEKKGTNKKLSSALGLLLLLEYGPCSLYVFSLITG